MIRRLIFSNGWIKLFAAALTATLYVFVQSEREVTTTVTPALVMRVPEGLINVAPTPDRLKVTITGPWATVSAVGREEAPPVEVDLTTFPEGAVTYYIDEELVRLRPGVRIKSIVPAALTVDLEPTATRRVPVRPMLQGEPAFGYRLGEAIVDPPRAELQGARSELAELPWVGTEPIDVSGATEPVQRQVRLAIGAPHVSRVNRDPVTVTVPVVEEKSQRVLEKVPVVLPEGVEAHVRPDTVALQVAGPARVVEPLTAGGVRVGIPAEAIPAPGRTARVPVRVNLPDGVRLVGEAPTVEVENLPASPE